jgi:hypothetical protein
LAKALSRPMKRLSKQLDRLEMSMALETSTDERLLTLAVLLKSTCPLDVKCSPARLAQQCGVNYKDIVTIYRDYKRSEAIVTAAQRLPKIVEDIALDAETREVCCAACAGKGYVMVRLEKDVKKEDCIPCAGSGKVTQSGDPVARKQILEMMELAGKGVLNISAPGSNVLVTGGESLEETLRNARAAKVPQLDGEVNGLNRTESGTIEAD